MKSPFPPRKIRESETLAKINTARRKKNTLGNKFLEIKKKGRSSAHDYYHRRRRYHSAIPHLSRNSSKRKNGKSRFTSGFVYHSSLSLRWACPSASFRRSKIVLAIRLLSLLESGPDSPRFPSAHAPTSPRFECIINDNIIIILDNILC